LRSIGFKKLLRRRAPSGTIIPLPSCLLAAIFEGSLSDEFKQSQAMSLMAIGALS